MLLHIMYVVAAASGRTGSVVAETLLAHGAPVRVIVRDEAAGNRWRARGAEVAHASLDDRVALEAALSGASGLYTILPEDPRASDFHGHRRTMASAIAGAVGAVGVPHVVLLSAAAAVLPDGNGPAEDLHVLENALRSTASRVTTLRASWFQENVLDALPLARDRGVYPCFLPSPDAAFPTNATRDVGTIAARSLLDLPAASEVVDIVGPSVSVRQIAEQLGDALGKPVHVVEIPPAQQLNVLLETGLPRPFAEALVELFACFGSGRITPRGDRMVATTSTLADLLRGVP